MAVCLSLTAMVQLNGRSIFAVGEGHGKDGAFATLVQPEAKGVAGGIAPTRGVIGRLLDSAGRPAEKPAAQPEGSAASSGTTPELATVAAPATAPTAPDSAIGGNAGRGPDALPPFKGLLSQLSQISAPSGFVPGDTTGTVPTQPTDGSTPPVTEPTTPVTDPTPPVSPVPEPSVWAMWLVGFGVVGGLIRWRRRALGAPATKGAGGDAA